MQITTMGMVLRERSLGDDRLLTLLTEKQGVVQAFANGAKRLKSKMSSSTELFCYSQFVLFQHKDRTVVNHADAEHVFFGIRQDLLKLALSSYFSELMAELGPVAEPAEEFLRLLLNTLYFLEKDQKSPALLKPLYELRMLTMAGYMPDLVSCAGCHCFDGQPMFFSPLTGQIFCQDCRQEQTGLIPLSFGVLAAMRHIIYSDFDKLFRFNLSKEGQEHLQTVTQRYMHVQLSRTFPSLEFYHSLLSPFDQGKNT